MMQEVAIVSGVVATFLTAITPVMIAYLKNRKELKAALLEMSFQSESLKVLEAAETWAWFDPEIRSLFEETEIDRVLILHAWNGKHDPKWVNAVLQLRDGEQIARSYIHVEIDDDYRSRLVQTIKKGPINFAVDKVAEEAMIKRIYQDEGVTHSAWFFVDSKETANGSVSIAFMSFASHMGPISSQTMWRCRMLVDRLREDDYEHDFRTD